MNAKDEMTCMLEQQEFYARRQAQLESIYEDEKRKLGGHTDNDLIEEILGLHDRIDELEERIDQLESGASNKKRSPFIQVYQGGDKPKCDHVFTLTDVFVIRFDHCKSKEIFTNKFNVFFKNS